MTKRTARGRSSPSPDPGFVPPMECTAVDEIPADRSRWLYEVKLDGYRCCAVAGQRSADLYSRYGNLWRDRFQHIRSALATLPSCVLDGEIVAVNAAGTPSFQELQNWRSTRHRIVFYAFDIVHFGGRSTRGLPLEERKAILENLPFADPIRLSDSLDAPLSRLVPQMRKLGLEGIVAKRRGSRYESGRRSPAWLKHRFNEIGKFVIGGFIPEGDTFSRLLVGQWKDGNLVFVKKLKNGFSQPAKKEVLAALRGLRTNRCPFVNLPERPGRSAIGEEVMKTVAWVKPKRSVEIEFVEWTASGRLRHASFRKLIGDQADRV